MFYYLLSLAQTAHVKKKDHLAENKKEKNKNVNVYLLLSLLHKQYIHSRNYVILNLLPENILVKYSRGAPEYFIESIKLTDFSMARSAQACDDLKDPANNGL